MFMINAYMLRMFFSLLLTLRIWNGDVVLCISWVSPTGPGSSDTTDESGSAEDTQLGGQLVEEASAATSDLDYEDARSGTPSLHPTSPTPVETSSDGGHYKTVEQPQNGLVVEYKSTRLDSVPPQSGRIRYPSPENSPVVARNDQASVCDSTQNQSKLVNTSVHSNSEENLRHDSNETSDTDRTSLSHATSPPRQPRFMSTKAWSNRHLESDFSTAPFSSETSDMDTSGNERGGPADCVSSNSVAAKANQVMGSSKDAPTSALSKSEANSLLPAKFKPSKGAKKELMGKAVSRPPVSKKPAALVNGGTKVSPSPPATRRPLLSSISNSVLPNTNGVKTNKLAQIGNSSPAMSPSTSREASSPPSPRPKPPLAAKPSRPGLKPKPPHFANGTERGKSPSKSPTQGADSTDMGLERNGRSQEGSQLESHQFRTVQSEANLRRGKTDTDGDSTRHASPPQFRKIHSDTDLGSLPHRKLPPRSPSAAVRKLTKLYEEKEPDEDSRPSTPPMKPAVASKPKRQPSDKRVYAAKPILSVANNAISSKEMTSGTASDSSKTPSSSETPPSLNQSPSVSPSPSPAARKKPQVPLKPSVPPKKPGRLHHSTSAASFLSSRREAGGENPKGGKKSNEGQSGPQPIPRSTNVGNKSPILPPAIKEEEAPVITRNKPLTPSPTPAPTVSNDSEQAPPIPPRKGNRRSTHIELVIPISDEQNSFYPPAPPEEEVLPPSLLSSRHQSPTPPSLRRKPSDGKRTTIARSTNVSGNRAPSTESQSPKRHSMFSVNVSPRQIRRIPHHYEVCEVTMDLTDPQETPASSTQSVKSVPRFKIKSQNTCALETRDRSPDGQRSTCKTSNGTLYESKSSGVGSLASSKKDSDSDVELSSSYSPTGRRYTTGSITRKKGPPKPPKYTSPSDDSGTATSTDRTTPPLPRRPTDMLPPVPPTARDNTPPPLPSQPIPRKKDRITPTRRKQTSPTLGQRREGSPLSNRVQSRSSSESPERIYDVIKGGQTVDPSDIQLHLHENSQPSPGSSVSKLIKRLSASADDHERVSLSSPESPVPVYPRDARSFSSAHSVSSTSSLMYRRATSDRYKHKVSTLDSLAVNGIDIRSLQRTPSVDRLDARMIRSTRNSMRIVDESSSDSDDDAVVVSPTQQGKSSMH